MSRLYAGCGTRDVQLWTLRRLPSLSFLPPLSPTRLLFVGFSGRPEALPSAYLLNVVGLRRFDVSEGISRILEELHLRQTRVERVRGGGDFGNRGVAGLFGGRAGVFGRAPELLLLLSDLLEFFAALLPEGARVLGDHPQLLGICPRRLRSRP